MKPPQFLRSATSCCFDLAASIVEGDVEPPPILSWGGGLKPDNLVLLCRNHAHTHTHILESLSSFPNACVWNITNRFPLFEKCSF